VDVWNFYFFFFLVPLWAGGLFVGLAAMHYALIYRPYRAASAYVLKKNLTPIIQAKKEYLAESAVLTRKRSQTELPVENPLN
jgi:nitrogen fixation protein